MQVSRGAPPPGRLAAAAEALFEELLELGVEDGVDDGVEGAVDVAQPGDGAHQPGWDVAGQAQSSRRVDHEERRPAEQEAAWRKGIEAEVVNSSCCFSGSFCRFPGAN